ncbi:MAG TPA: hypothetical protein VGF28_16405 [Thermoanaerobaculia bacterium]|jgi:tetratricopeptide (TPR) repeat protein
MRALKALAAAAICAAALAAIYFTAVAPVRWNRAAREAALSLKRADTAPSLYDAGLIARRVLEETEAFAGPATHDMRLHFHRAQAWTFVENHEAAIQHYRLALRLDQRPELYVGLANSLAATGRREEAVQSALLAVRFRSIAADNIADGVVRAEVEEAIARGRTGCDAQAEAAAASKLGRN